MEPLVIDWQLRDDERDFFQRELDSFIPDRVFDAHAHLWEHEHILADDFYRPLLQKGPHTVGAAQFTEKMAAFLPGRETEALFLPLPVKADIGRINQFMASQGQRAPKSRIAMLVSPEMDPDWLREEVKREGFAALKCSHVFSQATPPWEARIEDFLPEDQVGVADQLGLSVTLHIVRSRALADEANTDAIRRYCQKYPSQKLILAHAGRGFNPHHTAEGVTRLKGLGNVYFDSSAVTDSGAFEAIIHELGHDRLLYGSDFFISHMRGRCVAIGDSFLWLYENTVEWKGAYGLIQPILVGFESLRTLKLAAKALKLKDSQIEDIFWNNAVRLG